MALTQFLSSAPSGSANPLVVAMYWRDVLEDQVQEVLGISMEDFRDLSLRTLAMVRTHATHLENVANESWKTKLTGAGSAAAGSVMTFAVTVTAPCTAGLSFMAGPVLMAAGAWMFSSSILVEHGYQKADTKRAQQDSIEVVNKVQTLDMMLTICVYHFTRARNYLRTVQGQEFARLLEIYLRDNGRIDLDSAEVRDREVADELLNLLNGGLVAYRLRAVVEYLWTGPFSQANVQCRVVNQATRGAQQVEDRFVIMAGPSGSNILSVTHRELSSGLGEWDSSAARVDAVQMQRFATDLETLSMELDNIYEQLTQRGWWGQWDWAPIPVAIQIQWKYHVALISIVQRNWYNFCTWNDTAAATCHVVCKKALRWWPMIKVSI